MSLQTLNYVVDVDTLARHQRDFGGYNDFPPNWRPCTESEYWARMGGFPPVFREHRQMGKLAVGAPPLLSATLYFFSDGSGYAVSVSQRRGLKHVDGHRNLENVPRYFSFARCLHEYRAPTKVDYLRHPMAERPRMCLHVSVCAKCDHWRVVDSSD